MSDFSERIADATMREVWLHSNRRFAAVGLLVGALLLALGAGIAAVDAMGVAPAGVTMQIVGGSLLGLGAALLLPSAYSWCRPRLAFDGRNLLAYMKWGAPYRVPIELVECFFMGQTESQLPGRVLPEAESSSVVVRLAQVARHWHRQPVAPRLGDWFGGYIIVRGTWSALLDKNVVAELNQRLVRAHRQQKAPSVGEVATSETEQQESET